MGKKDDASLDSMLDDFESFENMDNISFGAQLAADDETKKEKKKKKKEEKKKKETEGEVAMDNWMAAMSNIKFSPKVDKKHAKHYDFDELFTEGKKHGKKKKKKKKGELTDFAKEFDQETRLVKNILAQQTKFTDSLQKRYDVLESSKTAARGVGKFTTDLIEAINTSRNIALAAVKELTSIKKTAFDLHMKEKKDNADAGLDEQNMNNFSANLLKQVISEDRKNLNQYTGEATPIDGSVEDLFSSLESEMENESRPIEIDKALEYESMGAKVYALVNRDSEDWRLVAMDPDGNEIPDYPLPQPDSLNINRNSGIASDEYHVRYDIIWE